RTNPHTARREPMRSSIFLLVPRDPVLFSKPLEAIAKPSNSEPKEKAAEFGWSSWEVLARSFCLRIRRKQQYAKEVWWRRRSDSNGCIEVLEASPLPLGYAAP